MLHRAANSAYSWWWASHIRTKQSKWLEQNLVDMEERVHGMLKIIEQEGDSFTRRVEMYYKKRPELIDFVEEAYRAYRALAERYDHLSKDLQSANRTIATVFPENIQMSMDSEDDFSFDGPSPDHPAKSLKKIPENIPKAPKFPKLQPQYLKSQSFIASQKDPLRNTDQSSGFVASANSYGLTKEEAVKEIDGLQKDILGLQTVKEFLKSSYESGLAKFWEVEENISQLQVRLYNLQDEFGVGTVIEDHEARTLMAATALTSCSEALTKLNGEQVRSMEEVRGEHERIKKAHERLEALKQQILQNRGFGQEHNKQELLTPKSFNMIAGGVELEEGLSTDLFKKKIRDKLNVDCDKDLTEPELSEKIDALVEKVVVLETNLFSQNGMIKRLRGYIDELLEQISKLEENKYSIAQSDDRKKRIIELEEELKRISYHNHELVEQKKNLTAELAEANGNLDHLREKLEHVKPGQEASMETRDEVEAEAEVEQEKVQDKERDLMYLDEEEKLTLASQVGETVESEVPDLMLADKDGLNWRKLYMNNIEDRERFLVEQYTIILRDYKDLKAKLRDAEKKNREHIFELATHARERRSTAVAKDKEIQVLRMKLDTQKEKPIEEGDFGTPKKKEQQQPLCRETADTSDKQPGLRSAAVAKDKEIHGLCTKLDITKENPKEEGDFGTLKKKEQQQLLCHETTVTSDKQPGNLPTPYSQVDDPDEMPKEDYHVMTVTSDEQKTKEGCHETTVSGDEQPNSLPTPRSQVDLDQKPKEDYYETTVTGDKQHGSLQTPYPQADPDQKPKEDCHKTGNEQHGSLRTPHSQVDPDQKQKGDCYKTGDKQHGRLRTPHSQVDPDQKPKVEYHKTTVTGDEKHGSLRTPPSQVDPDQKPKEDYHRTSDEQHGSLRTPHSQVDPDQKLKEDYHKTTVTGDEKHGSLRTPPSQVDPAQKPKEDYHRTSDEQHGSLWTPHSQIDPDQKLKEDYHKTTVTGDEKHGSLRTPLSQVDPDQKPKEDYHRTSNEQHGSLRTPHSQVDQDQKPKEDYLKMTVTGYEQHGSLWTSHSHIDPDQKPKENYHTTGDEQHGSLRTSYCQVDPDQKAKEDYHKITVTGDEHSRLQTPHSQVDPDQKPKEDYDKTTVTSDEQPGSMLTPHSQVDPDQKPMDYHETVSQFKPDRKPLFHHLHDPKTGIMVKDLTDAEGSPRSGPLADYGQTPVSRVEARLRAELNALLQGNLDFWLRFSTSFHQIQKFQSTIRDLQIELSKLRESKSKEGNHKNNLQALQSDARPLYKHLREIQTEMTLWLEHSNVFQEELKSRFSSLNGIQDEISIVKKGGDSGLSDFQAAKFQGEVLNMKQENRKVAEELQAGIHRVKGLKAETEKGLVKLNKEFKLSESKGSYLGSSRHRSSFHTFFSGMKMKKSKQKQPTVPL